MNDAMKSSFSQPEGEVSRKKGVKANTTSFKVMRYKYGAGGSGVGGRGAPNQPPMKFALGRGGGKHVQSEADRRRGERGRKAALARLRARTQDHHQQ